MYELFTRGRFIFVRRAQRLPNVRILVIDCVEGGGGGGAGAGRTRISLLMLMLMEMVIGVVVVVYGREGGIEYSSF